MAEDHDKHGGEEHGDGGHGGGGHGGGGHGAHGGGSHEEHEGAPEWLISFADNVALMMGFFVILLAMAMSKPVGGGQGESSQAAAAAESDAAMLDFVIAMREAFNSGIDPNGSNPAEARLRKRMAEKARSETNEPGPAGDKPKVQSQETSEYVSPIGIVPFDVNSAAVSPAGTSTISELAEQIRGRRVIIEIRGHVSAAEAVHDAQRGMKLSTDRALAVAKVLAEHGVKWNQLRLVACADSSPVRARAETPAEHRTNQRVEVVLNKEPPPPDQFSAENSRGGREGGGD